MEEGHISVQRSLRYFTTGEYLPGSDVLIALHGYSQHPKYFLQKMKELASDGRQFIAPEGLHRFYIQGHSGRVGASWMTKEDRLIDIEDNHRYLEQLMKEVVPQDAGRRILMGFSQGCATAVRYFCSTEQHFDRLILWAGSFPPDLPLPENLERLNAIGIDLVVGDEDEFIHSDHILELKGLFDQAGLKYRFHSFHGKHELNIPLLKDLLSK